MGKKLDEQSIGIFAALAAYILWGVFPLYWKLLNHVPADEVLAHRIIWSLVLMFVILLALGKLPSFFKDVKMIFSSKKQLLFMLLASIFISVNWFTYIWSVANEQLVEASLGYYINPLVSVVLAVIIFKEKLTRPQSFAFILATIGVAILAVYTGGIPIATLTLAFSFAFYGAIKKIVKVGALTSLAVETMLVTPIALIYLTMIHATVNDAFYVHSLSTFALLIGAGVATSVPLLLFAVGARRIPLSMIGFLQYLAPTITLLIGIFLFKEPFSSFHLLAFSFIWMALALYTFSKSKIYRRIQLDKVAKVKRTAS